MTDENDPNLNFVKLEVLTVPPHDLIKHIKNSYWICHPEKGAVFWRMHSPQCNTNVKLVLQWIQRFPWAVIVFIPSAFIKINPHDYV